MLHVTLQISSRVTGCPSVRVGSPPGDYCPRSRWGGPGLDREWRAGFSEPVLHQQPPDREKPSCSTGRRNLVPARACSSTDPLTTTGTTAPANTGPQTEQQAPKMLDVLAGILKPTNQPLASLLTLGLKTQPQVFNLMYYVLEGKQESNIGQWGSTPNNSNVTCPGKKKKL